MNPSFSFRIAAGATLIVLQLVVGAEAVEPLSPDRWTTNGPDGGWITAILRVGEQGPLLVGTAGAGVYRSDDDGLTWRELNDQSMAGQYVNDLALDERNSPPFVYAATAGSALFRAQGAGGSWGSVSAGLDRDVSAVAIHPIEGSSRLGVSTSNGFWTSRNSGQAWPDSLRWLAGFTSADIEVSPLAPTVQWGITGFDVHFSVDQRNHETVNIGLTGGLLVDLELGSNDVDHIWVASRRDGVFRSINGVTFTQVGVDGLTQPLMRVLELTGDDSALVGSERGLHHLPSGASDWTLLQHGLTGSRPDVWSIHVEEEDPLVLGLGTFNYGFVWTEPGGSAWQQRNQGLQAQWIEKLAAFDDQVLAGTRNGHVFHSTDQGQTWRQATGDLKVLSTFGIGRVVASGRWLVGTHRGTFTSVDQGETWTPVTGSLTNFISYEFVEPTWLSGVVYCGSSRGLHVSEDGGASWSQVPGLPAAPVFTLAEAATDQQIWVGVDANDVYAGSHQGTFVAQNMKPGFLGYRGLALPKGRSDLVFVGGGGQVARYQNGELTDVSAGLPDAGVQDLAYIPALEELFVATDAGVFRSPNLGHSWMPYMEGMLVEVVEDLALVGGSSTSPTLYAGTYAHGVFGRIVERLVSAVFVRVAHVRREDGAVVLQIEAPLLEGADLIVSRAVDGGAFQPVWQGPAGEVVARDDLAGVGAAAARLDYRVELRRNGEVLASSGTRFDLSSSLPQRTRLLANVPNPFNPRTEIRWEMASPGLAKVEVLDLRGRRLALLLDQALPAGRHATTWEGVDDGHDFLPSGVYLVRLVTHDGEDVQRITLLR